jgi:hypothetical protein
LLSAFAWAVVRNSPSPLESHERDCEGQQE